MSTFDETPAALSSWVMPKGNGIKETRSYTIKSAEGGETTRSYQAYVDDYHTINMLILNTQGLWQLVKTAQYNGNEGMSYYNPNHSYAAIGLYNKAAIIGKMFGGAVRCYDADTGAFIGQTESFSSLGTLKVKNLKYTGWDNDYSCEACGKNNRYFCSVPNRFIYWTGKSSGYIAWEFVQAELDAEKRLQLSYKREDELKREARIKGDAYPIDQPFNIDGTTYRFNATTIDPYIKRWEIWQRDDSWEAAGATINPLLDKLCGLPERTYEEWKQIGQERWRAANPELDT